MKRSIMALTFVSLGLLLIVLRWVLGDPPVVVVGLTVPEAVLGWLWVAAGSAMLLGVMIPLGLIKKIHLPWGATIDVPDVDDRVFSIPPRELPREVEVQRRDYAGQNEQQLPGRFAPAFQVLGEKLAFTVTPSADPMTPMYILDREFRIMDWNIAFSLCFDRTLEGRRGRNVLEWTYFLDNYEDVVNHGIGVFGPGQGATAYRHRRDPIHQLPVRPDQWHQTGLPDTGRRRRVSRLADHDQAQVCSE
jgi:hypothetical protein